VEPGGTPHHLVLGYPGAQLAFLDCRMVSSDAGVAAATATPQRRLEVGVWKTVEAHSKGQMTALAAHPNAPLLATATNSQVGAGLGRCFARFRKTRLRRRTAGLPRVPPA
jgi:hypothetical protein